MHVDRVRQLLLNHFDPIAHVLDGLAHTDLTGIFLAAIRPRALAAHDLKSHTRSVIGAGSGQTAAHAGYGLGLVYRGVRLSISSADACREARTALFPPKVLNRPRTVLAETWKRSCASWTMRPPESPLLLSPAGNVSNT